MQVKINGQMIETEADKSVFDAAFALDPAVAREALCALVNGEVKELTYVPSEGDELTTLTFEDEQARKVFWHTTSHVLAQAVKRLFPAAKFAIGPAIDSGFYYDFEVEKPFTAEDLQKITAEMKKIVKERLRLERFELPVAEAKELMKDEPYKLELIEEHAGKGEHISFYRQGDFTDLCAGPHLFDVSKIKAIALLSSTGAYWRGDSNRPMLQRIYGVSYPKAAQLEEHLTRLEEARKRDHNKIGRELEYFTTVDVIGQGLPILLPKGAKVIQQLQRWVEDEEEKRGYVMTMTPLMAKRELYKISGHWDHYLDGMFVLGDPNDEEKECFALRPMTCPFQYQAISIGCVPIAICRCGWARPRPCSAMRTAARCTV